VPPRTTAAPAPRYKRLLVRRCRDRLRDACRLEKAGDAIVAGRGGQRRFAALPVDPYGNGPSAGSGRARIGQRAIAGDIELWRPSTRVDDYGAQHFDRSPPSLQPGEIEAKIARLPIREWNFKAQDASIRHVGPTAQDFHAAFGLGEDPLRISTIDADGIALSGVRALALENQTLKAELAALRERLERIEAKQP
jgi:hypothetical protein